MMRIAPSILSSDFSRLADEIRVVEEGGADLLHVDVMDGHFVPNITIGPPVVAAIRRVTKLPLDCHLMITEPQQYIGAFIDAGADMISIHVEAEPHLERALALIRDGGARAGIAINPATSAELLKDALSYCDYVLAMTVNPGFGGQKFIPGVLPKIERIRSLIREAGSRAVIEVDGGIDRLTAPLVARAGAEILVAGSAIFGQSNRVEAIGTIRQAATSIAI